MEGSSGGWAGGWLCVVAVVVEKRFIVLVNSSCNFQQLLICRNATVRSLHRTLPPLPSAASSSSYWSVEAAEKALRKGKGVAAMNVPRVGGGKRMS